MAEQKISVIVPVYKVEAYLDRCIQSIVEQSYQNLEIILVDDGSPDHCPAMCDAWAEKDERIRVIHKKNGGLSDARNAGMAVATGELMGFVDSDDWIARDMYRLLHERMIADGSDIAACGVEMVWDDGTPSKSLTQSGCCVLNQEEAMRAIVKESWLKQPVWYKLYKTALIRDILFPVGKYHEDVFWSYQAVARVQRVSVLDTPCYFYMQRGGSIMGEGYSLRRLDALEARVLRCAYIKKHFPELVSEDQASLLLFCVYSMQMRMFYLKGTEQETAESRIERIVKGLRPLCCPREMAIKQRIWFYMAQLCIKNTCRLRNRLKIGL